MAEGTIVVKSTATKSLDQVSSILAETKDLLGRVHLPIAKLVVIFTKLDGYIADALGFLGFVDSILRVLHDGLQLCKYLGELIPEIGPILADAAAMIERLQIEQTVRKIVGQVRSLVEKGRDGVVKKVKAAASQISARLESLLDVLPSWTDTLAMMGKLFYLFDVGAYIFTGGTTDELIREALASLAGGALQKAQDVKTALQPVLDFLDNVWATFRDAIVKPIEHGFGEILDTLRPVMSVVQKCVDVCNTIKQWFEPFFWVLDAIQWIFEKTVGWLIDKVMNELGLRNFIDGLVQKVKDAIGITRIEEEIKKMMGSAMQGVLTPLKTIASPDNAKSIAVTVVEFSQDIQKIRKDPAQALIKVIQAAWSKSLPGFEPGLPYKWFDPATCTVIGAPPDPLVNPQGLIFNDVDDPIKRANKNEEIIDLVATLQSGMDDFVEQADRPDGFTDVNPNLVNLKFGYVLSDGHPVSVLLRIGQRRVVARQAPSLENLPELPPPKDAFSEVGEPADKGPPSEAPSGAKLPQFDRYAAMYKDLWIEMDQVKSYLTRLHEAASRADADFANYTPEAAVFCDYYLDMLSGLDPILSASQQLLNLPLKYETVLTQNATQWAKEIGLPDFISSDLFPGLFRIIAEVKAAIMALQTDKKLAVEKATAAGKAYSMFQAHVAQICSRDRFPKTLGPGVTNISSLVRLLERRLASTEKCFAAIYNLGESMFQNRDKMGDKADEVYAKLGAVYDKLLPVMDSTLKDTKAIPEQLKGLYDSLKAMHGDVQRFFKATAMVSELCRKVETKVIAADQVRVYCTRINNALGPFEAVLEELGLHPDPPKPSGDTVSLDMQTILKGVNERLAQPIVGLTDLLSEALYLGLQALIENFFKLSDVDEEMSSLGEMLRKQFGDDIKNLEDVVQQLIQLVEPKNHNLYSIPPAPPNGSTMTPGVGQGATRFQVSSPLLDDTTAQALGEILQEVNAIAASAELPAGASVATAIVTPKWAAPSVNPEPVVSYLLTARGREWDAVEPAYPSDVFRMWYELLERLDRVMAQRRAWQRTDPQAPLPQAMPALVASDAGRSALWMQLEGKAVVGGPMYEEAIAKPLRKPLRDRVDLLLRGTVRLPAEAADGDLLKQLPPPKEGVALAPFYFVRVGLVAPPAAEGANEETERLAVAARVFADRDEFEEVARDLYPRLAAAVDIYNAHKLPLDAGMTALAEIRRDYRLMDARAWLELTNDEMTARKLLEVVGDGGRLGR
ncbi:hypothetical protein MMYC01_210444 [Madurella mycetomatis]|uniref:Uncharacterized protein n=1 Tax=Madurella mycetomatis TaxID=100816 RepID=A0A175VNA3_9PEZI|nr:hypothetical protein MMYC01_210444 [Madurella mycetomatis]